MGLDQRPGKSCVCSSYCCLHYTDIPNVHVECFISTKALIHIDQIGNYQMLHLFMSLIPIDQILNEQVQAVPAVPKSH